MTLGELKHQVDINTEEDKGSSVRSNWEEQRY